MELVLCKETQLRETDRAGKRGTVVERQEINMDLSAGKNDANTQSILNELKTYNRCQSGNNMESGAISGDLHVIFSTDYVELVHVESNLLLKAGFKSPLVN